MTDSTPPTPAPPPRAGARIFVEGWAPGYGAPLDPDESLSPAEGTVDTAVETDRWAPVDGVDDGITEITFVDGVRRIDARLVVEDATGGPVPGLCGTFAVGAVTWDRAQPRSHVVAERIERWAVLPAGREETFPPVAIQPPYGTMTAHGDDAAAPIRALHSEMRAAEAHLAAALAQDGFVIADGPLAELAPRPVVGVVKSHRVLYLDPERNRVVGTLAPGQRTPLFTFGGYARYSWYVRLAEVAGGHAWSGVVRCEAATSLPLPDVLVLAGRTAALLPLAASEPHVDPRAPQNLVPVGGLERVLRHRMGDAGLVLRRLREAVMERAA
jgi:hypothetical protein